MIQVLVVEDDPMVMEITCKYVESVPGFEVMGRAENSVEARSELGKNEIDLLILDVFMPGVNGIDLLNELRAEDSQVDVIFLTAANDTHMIDRALKLGFIDYLIKPFNYERFKASLVNYQKMRELLNKGAKATQEQLDNTLKNLMGTESSRIHKGMHPKTLENIREYINSSPMSAHITQQEIAENLGLSRVTVRRYMEYLASTGEVAVHMEYGSVGRPSFTYQRI